MKSRFYTDRSGIVIPITILVVLAVAAIATGAIVIGSNYVLMSRYYERESLLDQHARGGLEYGRALLNGDPSLYPDTGYVTIENGVAVTDASGTPIPGVRRWLYTGPTGVTSGQYGVFGSIVSVVRDDGGAVAIRRLQVFQESFAKFAYFTDIEPSNISFGGGDQIFGPVHSNSPLKIYSSGATFHGVTRTAQDVRGEQYATFMQGYEEYAPRIEMPPTADLSKLQVQAAAGNMSFTSNTLGSEGTATTRIEFIAIDLNGDGDTTDDNEGFIRVYQSTDADWVTGVVSGAASSCGWQRIRGRWRWVCTSSAGSMETSAQCGAYYAGTFVAAASHPFAGNNAIDALTSPARRCHLGGSDSISGGFVANDGTGSWLPWPGPVSPLLAARADKDYLFPLARSMNPSFKGVIYVQGNVAISGTLRGRVTLAATADVVLADDIVYATDPGAGTCVDMLGIFAGDDVIVADNAMNAPVSPKSGFAYRTYDDTKDEFFHGIVLALDIFTVRNYSSGSTNAESCETKTNGRGCLYLTGGIIQKTRGAVGTGSGTGYVKRYAYDPCGATSPPPYFPTTGHFSKSQYFQVDPVGFSVGQYFDLLTP